MSDTKWVTGDLEGEGAGLHEYVFAPDAEVGRKLVCVCYGPDCEKNAARIAALPALLAAAKRARLNISAWTDDPSISLSNADSGSVLADLDAAIADVRGE